MDLVTRQREERKQRILDVTRRLVVERGYDGVTMRELAEKSLVSVPTLYNLFGGKNELLLAAVESYFADLIGSAGSARKTRGLERLLAIAETLGRETPRHAAYARSLMGFFGNVSDAGGIHEFVVRELTLEVVAALDEMKGKRQLAAWADTRALGGRISSQISITTFEWARNQVTDEALLGAILYGTGVTLLGVARGKAAAALERLVRENQGDAAAAAGSTLTGTPTGTPTGESAADA
jgi:AcrR family transcriptional regulator